MTRTLTVALSACAGLATLAVGAWVLWGGTPLMRDDLAGLRREALDLFPRGSRVAEAYRRLVAMGFRCEAVEHKLANVTSPSLACDSNGRGFPSVPAYNVTVLGRDGVVADVDVWNTFGTAGLRGGDVARR